MLKRAARAGLLPGLVVTVVLIGAFVAPGRTSQLGPFSLAAACYGTYPSCPAPTVTSVSPNQGPIAGGTTVTVTGTGFGNIPTTVKFGATPGTSVTVISDTQLTVVSPAGTAGPVDVTVTTASGTSATSVNDRFTYTAFSCDFQWYDKASTGFVQDNIHVINTSSVSANVFVSVPGAATVSATLAAGATTYLTFPQGTIGGPVVVNSDQTVISSQRVQYNQSFNEVWCETPGQASMTSYFNWYDKASDGFNNDNVHLLNPGTTTSNVTVSLTGVSGVTPVTVNVAAGAGTYVNFPQGTIGGPIKVVVNSGPAVLASQRVQYYGTFNEVWAQPATLAATTTLLNWYDLASTGFVQDNVHLLNPQLATANVTVTMGSASVAATVLAGGETYVKFPAGTIGGPVTVTSSVAILASQRVQYNQSFNEEWAQTAAQALTVSRFTWFDKASTGFSNVNVHLLNPGSTTATVTVVLGSTTLSATVAAGAETYVTFPFGTIGGPVVVTSNVPILAAERTQYFQTFNEISSS